MLREELTALLGAEKVLWKVSDLVRYASDASPYRFVPQVVVIAEDIDDVSAVLSYAHGRGREVVFRAAGTSLGGQAQGEDILVDVRRHWAGVEVLEDGRRARIRPGTTVLRANAALARHGRILGPDPASAIACTLGGVIANNSSGMTAGTTRNAYRTLSSLTLVLPGGTVVDTADPLADEELARAEPALCHGLMDIKREIEADPGLVSRIRAKYEIKNTTGYRLDAYLDGTTPVEILRGLMVGSEGTLGFIAEAVFDTLPLDREVVSAPAVLPVPARRGGRRTAVQRGRGPRRRGDGRQHAARLRQRRGRARRLGAAAGGHHGAARGVPRSGRGGPRGVRAPGGRGAGRAGTGGAGGLGDQRLHARSADDLGLLEGPQGLRHRRRRRPRPRHHPDHRGLRGTALPAGRGLRGAPRAPVRSTASTRRSPVTRPTATCTSCWPSTRPGPPTWSGTRPSWRRSAGSRWSGSTAP
ncbi:hypothetical protein GCM10020254_17370 [Streptomyces goshikiensis]